MQSIGTISTFRRHPVLRATSPASSKRRWPRSSCKRDCTLP